MKDLIIDRILEDIAVCEVQESDKITMVEIKVKDLPEGIEEGDYLIKKDGKYTIDANETKKRRERIKSKFKNLFQ